MKSILGDDIPFPSLWRSLADPLFKRMDQGTPKPIRAYVSPRLALQGVYRVALGAALEAHNETRSR